MVVLPVCSNISRQQAQMGNNHVHWAELSCKGSWSSWADWLFSNHLAMQAVVVVRLERGHLFSLGDGSFMYVHLGQQVFVKA